MPEPSYLLRPIDPTDRVNKLKLDTADGALSAFLQRSSRAFHENNYAKTFVFVDQNEPAPRKVVAYLSILASEIKIEDPLSDPPPPRNSYPAIKIGRLAVDNRLHRRSLGKQLVAFAVATAKREIMPRIGCRLMVVDANRPAIDFYKKCGFVMLNTKENATLETPLMFIDLQKIG